jgi:radical SAM superfamily enzyme YgiQ (UPF0313 family)
MAWNDQGTPDPEDDPAALEAWLLEGLSGRRREASQAALARLSDRFPAFDLLRRDLPRLAPYPVGVEHILSTFEQAVTVWRARRGDQVEGGIRILLVQSPNQPEVGPVGNVSCYQPEGIWRIGSHVTATVPSANVRLADGTLLSTEEIEHLILTWQPDLVGVSVLTPTLPPARRLSACAKRLGAIVVWGNDHASQNVLETLAGRPFVDAVIRGDSAERPFTALVEVLLGQRSIDDIESTSWRTHDGIRTNPMRAVPLAQTLLPDTRLIPDFDAYAENFNRTTMYRRWHDRYIVPAVTNFARGCHWGARRCIYCDIVDLTLQRMGPRRVWQWVDLLRRQYGVNLLYEVCDNFTSFAFSDRQVHGSYGIMLAERPSWLDRLLTTRPAHLHDIEWFVYGRADDFAQHPDLGRKLKELGVVRVNMGLDHADDRMLNRALRKGNRGGATANRQAVEALAAHGIQGYFSIVVGGPGETHESLEAVRRFVEWVTDTMSGLVVCWDPSILLPLKGAPIWDVITDPHKGAIYFKNLGINVPEHIYDFFRGKYTDFDNVDTQEITREAMSYYCPDISYEDAERLIRWIYALCEERGIVPGGFGIRGLTTGIGTPLLDEGPITPV